MSQKPASQSDVLFAFFVAVLLIGAIAVMAGYEDGIHDGRLAVIEDRLDTLEEPK